MAAFWNRLFDIQSLEHGRNYFLRGQVQNLRQEGMRFTAEVQGTATYQVELEWEPDCVGSMTCGCPYAQRGNRCKHMAAVLFAISSSHADWEEALERLPAEALRRLLHDLAARDEHLRERLVRTANGPGDTRELWKLDLQRMMNRYVPYGDWFDYHDAEQLMTDFSVYLEDNTEYLLRVGRLLDASRLTELVYGTAMEVQMDDSAGGLTMLMEDCHRIWNRLIEAADSEIQQQIFHQLWRVAEAADWELGSDDLEDYLLRAPWSEPLRRENLDRLDERIGACKLGDWELLRLLKTRAELMAALGASEGEVIAFWEEFRYLPSAREQLLSLYEYSDIPAAIALLLECRKTDDKHDLLRHTKKLIELYQKSGQQARYEQELRHLILELTCLEIPYVSQLKTITPPDEWPHTMAKLFAMAEQWTDLLNLLQFEQMYEPLLDQLSRHRNLNTFLLYEESLRRWSPQRTMELFICLLKQEMDRNCERKMYRHTIAHLASLHQYPNGPHAAQSLARYWFQYHKNRPAMKDELRKAGYVET